MHIHDVRSTHAFFGFQFTWWSRLRLLWVAPGCGAGCGDYRGLMGFSVVFTMGKTMGKPWENIGFHGKTMGTCLKKIGFQWENTKIELVGWKIWCLMISNYHVMMILCLKTRYTTTKPIGLSWFSEIRTTILGYTHFRSRHTHMGSSCTNNVIWVTVWNGIPRWPAVYWQFGPWACEEILCVCSTLGNLNLLPVEFEKWMLAKTRFWGFTNIYQHF